MISQTNISIMQKPVRIIYDMSEDIKIRITARMCEKALYDKASALKTKQNGIDEKRTAEHDNVINKMRSTGMTDEQINAIIKRLVITYIIK